MYLTKTWKNDGESGAIPLNKTNLQTIDNGIEGAIGRKFDLRYFYANNVCKLNDCNTSTDWENGAWDNSNGTASGISNAVRMSLSTIGYGIKYQYTSFIGRTISDMVINEADLSIPTSIIVFFTISSFISFVIIFFILIFHIPKWFIFSST